MFNNAIKSRGQIIGFKCFECGGVYSSMWGIICNGCREAERRNAEVVKALKELANANAPTNRG